MDLTSTNAWDFETLNNPIFILLVEKVLNLFDGEEGTEPVPFIIVADI